MVELPDGKKKRKLDKYYYDLGSCTFCMLCVTTCPQNALEFSNDFEQAVFTRDSLVKILNYRPEVPGPAPAPKTSPEPKSKTVDAPATTPASKVPTDSVAKTEANSQTENPKTENK